MAVADRALFTRLPQALFALVAAGALLVHFFVGPLPWPAWPWLQLFGAVVAAIGVNLMLAAAIAMSQRNTSPMPWQESAALVTHGVYRWSRNPIYLGDVLLVGGLGLWFGVGWLLIGALICIPLANLLVIRHEEAYVAEKFPGDWKLYADRVRRWL